MAALSDVEKKMVKTFCDSSDVPAILINSDLICVYSNDEKIFPAEKHFGCMMETEVELKSDTAVKTMVKLKDKFYCAVITPITDDFYICQMYDSDNIFEMAQNSEVYDEMLWMLSSNETLLRSIEDSLKHVLDWETVKENCTLDTELLNITANISEARGRYDETSAYLEVSFSKNNRQSVFSLYRYVEWCVDKCNSFLANVSRHIVLDCQKKDMEMLISANVKHMIFSIIDLIHYVLLNSKTDSEPIISIARNKDAVEFLIICRGLIYVPSADTDDFCKNDISRDIVMVRRFTKKCKAEFRFVNNEQKNIIGFRILFPEYSESKSKELLFESDEIVDFDDIYTTYIDHKMDEVINAVNLDK